MSDVQRPGLRLNDVTIAIDGRRLFDGLSLVAEPGEVQTVMGPSGVGKSSLIAYVAGALSPSFEARGEIHLNGRRLNDLPIEARKVGVLYQDDLLFAHMSVGDNLAFAIPPKVAKAERKWRVAAALSGAELDGFAGRDPATLSGGQKARVSLMRALLAEPEALLLDEPFSKLDAVLRTRMRDFTFAQTAIRKLPVILVTHDPADARGPILTLG